MVEYEKPKVFGNMTVFDMFGDDHAVRIPMGRFRIELVIRKYDRATVKGEELKVWDGAKDVTSQLFEPSYNKAEIKPNGKNLMLVLMHLNKILTEEAEYARK